MLIVFFLCPGLAQAAPETQPALEFTARDLPLDLHGASGSLHDWLKAFDLPPREFAYSTSLRDQDGSVMFYRLEYPSPFVSPWPEINVVPCEYYVPAHPSGKMRAAIVLDILDGSAVLPRALCRGLANNGIAALYIPMACYNQRRPKGDAHIGFFIQDPDRAVDIWRQTVMDIRRAKAILASRPQIDPAHISITGISLGGIVTSLAAGVDGQFDCVVPILAGGDIASLTFTTRETRGLRARMEERHITEGQLAKIMAPVEPLNFASRIDSARCLMINALQDEVIPRAATDLLSHAIGHPQILWAPAGHYSAVFYLPSIQATVARFIERQPVSKIAMTEQAGPPGGAN